MNRGSLENLLNVYRQATRNEREAGKLYYRNQRDRIDALGQKYGFGLEASVGAFAALSPNSREADTYRDLAVCMKHVLTGSSGKPVVSAYPRNCAKAMIILRGKEPEGVLKGSKVQSFYHNTIDPDDAAWVTIDGHMVSAWVGNRLSMKREARVSESEYRQIRRHVIEAATSVGILPSQFHSTIWLVRRRINRYGRQLPFDF